MGFGAIINGISRCLRFAVPHGYDTGWLSDPLYEGLGRLKPVGRDVTESASTSADATASNSPLEHEVAELRRVEESLRESESLYHSLVENLPQYILRKDRNCRFTFANTRFCNTLGRTFAEIKGKTDFDLFPADLAAKYQQDDRQVMERGITIETIEAHAGPAGERMYVQVLKTPIRDADGE